MIKTPNVPTCNNVDKLRNKEKNTRHNLNIRKRRKRRILIEIKLKKFFKYESINDIFINICIEKRNNSRLSKYEAEIQICCTCEIYIDKKEYFAWIKNCSFS
jgi:hypothetical protein